MTEGMGQLDCKQTHLGHLRKVKSCDWLSRKGIIISLVTGACQVGNKVNPGPEVKWELAHGQSYIIVLFLFWGVHSQTPLQATQSPAEISESITNKKWVYSKATAGSLSAS